MMTAVLTFLSALLVVGVCMAVFVWLGAPVYRVEPVNVRVLLSLLLEGKATQSDWDVFIGMPIRHNPRLDTIRRRCRDIVAGEAVVNNGKIRLSERGKQEVKALLEALPEEK